MKHIEFAWRREPSGLFGYLQRPVISLTVGFKGKWIPQIFYLDSGADITLIPRSVGKLLGFPTPVPLEKKVIWGIGQKGIVVAIRRVQVLLDGQQLKLKVAWAYKDEVPLLLGRIDFFSSFNILFAKAKKTLIWR